MATGQGPARKIDRLLHRYGARHRHPVNEALHWIGIPMIVLGTLALLRAAPVPGLLATVPHLDWATLAALSALIYYFSLSLALALGMAVFCLIALALITAIEAAGSWPLWPVAAGAFLAGWILQLVGHWIEGRKPSLLSDLRFLLIGPAWLLHRLYRRLGLLD